MGIDIYDYDGNKVDEAWLEAEFGNVRVHPMTGPGWYVKAIRAKRGDVAFIARLNEPNVDVAWYWPDAPEDQNAGPENGLPPGVIPGRAFKGTTNENGEAGFAMGTGAYYDPATHEGPHAAWVYGAYSQVLTGIGMLVGTNHNHPNAEWEYRDDPTPPNGDLGPKLDRIGDELERIGDGVERMVVAQEKMASIYK